MMLATLSRQPDAPQHCATSVYPASLFVWILPRVSLSVVLGGLSSTCASIMHEWP